MESENELKLILLELVEQLKPKPDQSFGTTDEWRFPYIIEIKPYSKRYDGSQLDKEAKEALEWFRTSVPERTFYNWINSAARLIAKQLKNKYLKSDR